MTVEIPFRLTKGLASDMRPTASVLSQAVLAKALVYCGVTAPHFKSALKKAATEALLADHQVAQELTDDDKRITAVIDEVQEDVISRLPRIPRQGSVSVKVIT